MLERHGYHEPDNQHTGRAIGVIRDLARVYEGTRTPPTAPTSTRPRPRHTPSPDDRPARDPDAVILTGTDVSTVLAALDVAADYKRDRAEMCADCPDQSCPACQTRLQDARAYDQMAGQMLQSAEAAQAARYSQGRASRLAPPIRARSRQGGRPVTIHGRTPDEPGTRRQADGPHVPAQRPGDRDMREMQDPYDLPFPDYSDRWPPGRPRVRDRGRPAPRLAARRASVAGRTPGNRTHPRTRTRPGSRTMTPTRK